MAGIQIDGVNNKIDFDDDQDTSISANTDDTLQVEVGGASIATMTASTVVFNEASADVDFRVESNGNANMLFVNGGTDRVGIGETTPLGTLHVRTADTGASVQNDANELVLEQNGACGLTILSANNAGGNIFFGDAQDNDVGRISYGHVSNTMEFRSNATTFLSADADGHVTMPKQSSFRVQPSSEQTNISVDAWNTIAFGTEAVDTNGDFASNTFTAPVTGTYALSGAMYLQNLDSAASTYQVQIHTSNDSYSILVIVPAQLLSADTQYYAFAGAVFADMDASDTAIIRIYQEGGTAQTDINVSTVFTGHLLG